MTILNEIVAGLKAQIEGFATSLTVKLAELNAARDAANNAVQTLLNSVLNTFGISSPTVIWVDMIDGDDSNTGLSPDQPLKTWKATFDAMRYGRGFVVRFMDDAIADYTYFITNPPSLLALEGWSKDGTARIDRKIRFVDSISLANNCGGLYLNAGLTLSTRNISPELAHNNQGNPFYVSQGRFDVLGQFGTITRTGTSTTALFNPRTSAHFEVNAIVIDPSASGYVITGVPAGGDPNNSNGISANFDRA